MEVAELLDCCQAFQDNCDELIERLVGPRVRKLITDPRKFQRRLQRQQGVLSMQFRIELDRWLRLIDLEYRRVLRHLHIMKLMKVEPGAIFTRLYNFRYIEEQGKEILKPAELRIYQQGAESAVQFAGLRAMFDVNNPEFAKIAEARAGALVTGISESVRKNIHDSVVMALDTGQSIDVLARTARPGLTALPVSVNRIEREMAAKIAAGMPSGQAARWAEREMTRMKNYRGMMIARTEASAAMNEGALIGYEAAGVKMVEFLASPNACNECLGYAGQRMTLSDAEGLIPVHPNGMCTWVPVVEPAAMVEPEVVEPPPTLEPVAPPTAPTVDATDMGIRDALEASRKPAEQLIDKMQKELDIIQKEYHKLRIQNDKRWSEYRKGYRQLTEMRAGRIQATAAEIDAFQNLLNQQLTEMDKLNTKLSRLLGSKAGKAIDVLGVDKPVNFKLDFRFDVPKTTAKRYERTMKKVGKLTNHPTAAARPVKVTDIPRTGRAWAANDGSGFYIPKAGDPHTVVHEMGHVIEGRVSAIHRRCLEFYDMRTAGEKAIWLGDEYDKFELSRKDKFWRAYTGKSYNRQHTEILSMGMQHIYEDPVGFLEADPEHFRFVLAVLRGWI